MAQHPTAPTDSPRTFVLSRQLAYPPRGGVSLRGFQIVRALAAIAPTYVFGLAPGGGIPPGLALEGWRTSIDPDAASAPHGVAFLDAIRAGESPGHLPISPIAATDLEAVLKEFAPDVVVVRGAELAPYIPLLRAGCPSVILDIDYAQADAMRQMGANDPNRARGISWRHASAIVGRSEAELVRAVDQIWVSSAAAAAVMRETYPDAAPVVVAPNVVDVASYPRAPRADPASVLYTGRFDYWPNEQAAEALVHDILPLLHDASISLVGLAPTPWMCALEDPRVTVTGPVDDIRPFLERAGVLAVPISAGAGTRFKVLEAFASEVPVVSTAKGVEGLDLVDGRHYLRAEEPRAFASAIDDLRRHPGRAAALVGAAHSLVEERYSLPALEQAVRAGLSDVTARPGTR